MSNDQQRLAQGILMVLVIDDSELIHDMVQFLLSSAGWEVLTAWRGEEGVARVQAQRDAIKVVLLDLHMPGMGGLATFHALRDLAPDLPIIIFTAVTPIEVCRYFPDQSDLIVLEKSCSRAELLAALNTHALQG